MTHLDRQIRAAQHRLWFNRWLYTASVCTAIALAVIAVTILIQRSFDLDWPVRWIVPSLFGIGVLASLVWTGISREGADAAAARLDQAAGLRERLSSARHCRTLDDPFAQAVLADAERVSASVTAKRHLPLSAPRPLRWTVSSAVLVALTFLVAPGWLKPVEESRAEQVAVRVEQTKNDVEKRLEPLRRLVDANPVLEQYREEIDGLDKQAGGRLRRPEDIRHEAVKKIDNLTDTLRRRREREQLGAMREMRKMMRRVTTTEAPTDKLSKALAKGDFKTAREEIEKIKEQLATLKSEKDEEMVKKLSAQLERISKQIAQAADKKQLIKEMKKAGLSQKDAKRMLESLSKKDIDQLKKELADKGLNEQQVEKLVKQLQQKAMAGDMARQLAQKLGQAAKAAQTGQAEDATSELSATGEQLSQLEQLEQEMGELDSALAALNEAKGDVGKGEGDGEGRGNKPGPGGQGPKGRGRGGIPREEKTEVGFKTERGKVAVGKGGISGAFLVDGEQVPGEVGASVSEVVSAAERDASDRIKRDRIPRQYQDAVKAYFSNVKRSIKTLNVQPPSEKKDAAPERDAAPSKGEE